MKEENVLKHPKKPP